jgi:hypothetical protein
MNFRVLGRSWGRETIASASASTQRSRMSLVARVFRRKEYHSIEQMQEDVDRLGGRLQRPARTRENTTIINTDADVHRKHQTCAR